MSVPYYEPHLFRHLCPEEDERQAMNDDEFWARVGRNLGFVIDVTHITDVEDQSDLDTLALTPQPCPVCGSSGACAYDAEGRALIHPDEIADE